MNCLDCNRDCQLLVPAVAVCADCGPGCARTTWSCAPTT